MSGQAQKKTRSDDVAVETRQKVQPAYRRAPEQKRASLMNAARVLFAQHGFDATSTLQIARAAGVSEGILFHHFGSKKGLFVALAEEFAQSASATVMPEDAVELTEDFIVRSAFDFADANPALYDMMAKGSAELSELDLHAQTEIIINNIEEKLRLGMSQGVVRKGNANIMARLQFALVDAAYREWRLSEQPQLREDYIEEAVNCMRAMMS